MSYPYIPELENGKPDWPAVLEMYPTELPPVLKFGTILERGYKYTGLQIQTESEQYPIRAGHSCGISSPFSLEELAEKFSY